MAAQLSEVLRQALSLPEEDRGALAGRLLESLEAPPDTGVEDAWAEEVERRLKDLDEGRVKPVSLEEARARLFGDT